MIERMPVPPILWTPDPDVRATTRIGAYLDWLWRERGLRFAGYDDLLRWSTSDLDGFWGSIWDHFEVSSETHTGPALADETMPGARWFPTRAPELGRALPAPARAALGVGHRWSSRARRRGIGSTLTARRAARRGRSRAAPGSSASGSAEATGSPPTCRTSPRPSSRCSPPRAWARSGRRCAPGVRRASVVDRFSQIEPKVLLAVDGYRYGEREVDRARRGRRHPRRAAERSPRPWSCPTSTRCAGVDGAMTWDGAAAEHGRPALRAGAVRPPALRPLLVGHDRAAEADRPRPRRHPRSSTSRRSPCTTTSGPADRFFWFTHDRLDDVELPRLRPRRRRDHRAVRRRPRPIPTSATLWRLAAEDRASRTSGISAPYLMACRKAGLRPARARRPVALRGDRVDRRAASGGGVPLGLRGGQPDRSSSGRSQRRHRRVHGVRRCVSARAGLGGRDQLPPCSAAPVEAFDAGGPAGRRRAGRARHHRGRCRRCPSGSGATPTARATARRTSTTSPACGATATGSPSPSAAHASSPVARDATLNRGGVRLGTAEFYAVVEALPEIADSLVVHSRTRRRTGSCCCSSCLRRRGDARRGAARAHRAARCARSCRRATCPTRSSPCRAIPRTLSGKKLEVPVKRILQRSAGRRGRVARLARRPELARSVRGAARGIGVDRTAA